MMGDLFPTPARSWFIGRLHVMLTGPHKTPLWNVGRSARQDGLLHFGKWTIAWRKW